MSNYFYKRLQLKIHTRIFKTGSQIIFNELGKSLIVPGLNYFPSMGNKFHNPELQLLINIDTEGVYVFLCWHSFLVPSNITFKL